MNRSCLLWGHEMEGLGIGAGDMCSPSDSCCPAPTLLLQHPTSCPVSFPPLLHQECGCVWVCPSWEHVCPQPPHHSSVISATLTPQQLAHFILEPSGVSYTYPLAMSLTHRLSVVYPPFSAMQDSRPRWMPFPFSFPFYF